MKVEDLDIELLKMIYLENHIRLSNKGVSRKILKDLHLHKYKDTILIEYYNYVEVICCFGFYLTVNDYLKFYREKRLKLILNGNYRY